MFAAHEAESGGLGRMATGEVQCESGDLNSSTTPSGEVMGATTNWSAPARLISDGGKLERLARVTSVDEAARTVEELCARVIDGGSVKEFARDWGLPRHRFEVWLAAEPERREMVEAAHRFRAADLVSESLAVADEQHMVEKPQGGEYDPDVPRDALRVKTRLAIAGFYDRKRFGTQGAGSGASVRVVVDRSCGVAASGTTVSSETTAVAVDLGVL